MWTLLLSTILTSATDSLNPFAITQQFVLQGMVEKQMTLFQVLFILIVYNIIYMLPLMILYIVYIKSQDKFDCLYNMIKTQITKWANILAPTIVGIIGIVLVYHSVSFLLK